MRPLCLILAALLCTFANIGEGSVNVRNPDFAPVNLLDVNNDPAAMRIITARSNLALENRPMVRLEMTGASGESVDDIFTTMDHPFYVEGKGWLEVGSLRPGDQLVSGADDAAGALLVKAITQEGYTATTYNLTVANARTFFVGEQKIWTHNTGPCDGINDALAGRTDVRTPTAADADHFGLHRSNRSDTLYDPNTGINYAVGNDGLLREVSSTNGFIDAPLQGPRVATNGGASGFNNRTWGVDSSFRAADENAGVLVNGSYIRNPSAQPLPVSDTGRVLFDGRPANGQYMYVVDQSGSIILGTRSGQRMPHPTLIGGADPQVRAAGIVDIRGGRLHRVDNSSGHFRPDESSLQNAEAAFGQLPDRAMRGFQGYVRFDE